MEFGHVSEGKVEITGKDNDATIAVEPVFGTIRGPKTVAYLTLRGDKGRERLYSLVLTRGGRLSLSEFVPAATTPFDQLDPSAEEPPESDDTDTLPLSR